MPKKAVELSAVEVKRLTHPGHTYNAIFAVGGVGGLLLQITPNGAKTWLLRYSLNGRRRHMGLGGYPDVTLAQARERAREARESIWRGEDPVEARRAQRAQADAERLRTLTFADAMERYLEVKLSEFGNAKHRKQWRSTLDTYAIPAIGQMAVGDIDVHDVQRAVAPIWHSKTETASRLRGRIESVLAWATVNGHRTGDNPARWRGNLDAVLPKPSRINSATHHPALALSDASAWFSDLLRRNGTAARALEYMALTAARSGEVRGAQWDEIDFQTAIWTVPADRMKAHREHRVPLTEQALDVLRRLPRQLHSPLLFPAPRGGMLSDMALSACMRRIHAARPESYVDSQTKRPAVPHGLRSTFRDWAAERTEFPSDMAEIALAHKVGTEVERAYRRGDMIDRRRRMMEDWARFLDGESTQVVNKVETGRS